MNLIAAMSLAGSITMLLYYSACLILRKEFGASAKDMLLKIAMFFFLVPIPRIKYWLLPEAAEFLPEFFHPEPGGVVRFGAFGHTAIPLDAREYLIVESWKVFGAAVGVCVALGFIGYQAVRYFRLKRLVWICTEDVSRETFENNPKFRKMCGKKRVRIRKISGIQTPFTLGVLRPVIFLTEQEFTQEELEFVLCHETAHIKRRDILVKWIGLLVVLLHWFNPLSYLLLREINKISEIRCDDAALRIVGDEKRGAYAQLVVRVAAMSMRKTELRVSSLSGSKKDIFERVDTIMERRRMREGLGIAVAVIAIAFSSVGSTYAYEQEETWSNSDTPKNGEEVVFIPDTDENDADAGAVDEYFETPEIPFVDFTRSDTVFIENATGNIIYLEEELEKPEEYRGCAHKYQSGTLHKHIKNSSGGCTILVYKGKYCQSCGYKIYEELISSMKYIKCPH